MHRMMLIGLASVLSLAIANARPAQAVKKFKIGTIGPLASSAKADVAEKSLRELIQTETGLEADIVRFDDWQKLADRLADNTIQVGVLAGHEFVWAQVRQPRIKPMALAVNGSRYPVVCALTATTDSAKALADLRGRPLAVPKGVGNARLFVDRHAQSAGSKLDAYFGKLTISDTSEDALDDAVDGVVAGAIVERVALETFQRRKAGRFAKLKEIAHTGRMLPPTIAVLEGGLDDDTRKQFQECLFSASKTDRGQMLLSLFKLTSFDPVPADFAEVAAESRRAFPAPTP